MSTTTTQCQSNNNVLLPPHLLFEAMRLNAASTPPPPPSESISESVGSNHISDCDHGQEVSSSSSSSSSCFGNALVVRRPKSSRLPCSFDDADQPAAQALLRKKHKPSSSPSSNGSYAVSRNRKRSLFWVADSASTTWGTAMKKQKPKGSDLEGVLCLPHQIFHYFRTIHNRRNNTNYNFD